MEKYDEIVKGAYELAQAEALNRKHTELTEAHLFYGFLLNPRSAISKHLSNEKKVIKGLLEQLPTATNFLQIDQIKPSPRLQQWFTVAHAEAVKVGRSETNEADFAKTLQKFFPQISAEGLEVESEREVPDFLVNLNDLANEGKLDPVIGRSTEIQKVMEILCRRTKNNPVLLGLPGVGKTAIVEGLSDLIVRNKVPDAIQEKTIYAMNMGSLMANTKYRGEFEEKIEALLKFLKSQQRDAILFIDEIHLLIGAGKTDGAMDAANLLKPALARGELNCIGATTLDEYKKFIESDSALERRFHQVKVEEPTKEDSIQILMGLKEKFEIHHGIEITEDAIVAAVYCSDLYIADRFLPDKAIDVIDESAAGLKLSADSIPPEIQEQDALIRSKKILLNTQHQNKALQEEIQMLEKDYQQQMKGWSQKNMQLKQSSLLKSQLDDAQFRYQKAESEGNYELASKIMYGEIPDLQKQIDGMEVSHRLTKDRIAEVIARNTGVPKERILQSRQENMLELASFLKNQVLGQDDAIDEIADTLIASHAGLSDQSQPLGSFLSIGPSGVGKTETAKAIAEYLFQSEKNVVRVDLSEYRESHSIAKLIGPPPGYIGYEKGGMLTETIRRKPYSVILFDELEKAHQDFGDILLQILDDGRLTDSQGRVVNFKNTVIIVTSNLQNYQDVLKPELIGRFDAVLSYHHLAEDTIYALVDRELERLNQLVFEYEVHLNIHQNLLDKIAEQGFDQRYGARPLKNAFHRLVTRPVSKQLLQNQMMKGEWEMKLNEHGKLVIQS